MTRTADAPQEAVAPSHHPTDHPVPGRSLSVLDVIAVVVGTVIGAGIFQMPSLVAGNVNGPWLYLGLWVAGGVVSVIGAMCYAELATAYPDAGGEYHFLHRAYGPAPAFLFAWARLSVIQTGSIALQAFIVGNYATEIYPIGGNRSPAIYAAITVAFFTALNVAGVKQGKTTQKLLTLCEVTGVLLVIVAGIVAFSKFGAVEQVSSPAAPGEASSISLAALGMGLVFVLYTYGGWNEAAYLSAEVKSGAKGMLWSLLGGIGLITLIYLLANVSLVLGLGTQAMAKSNAVAADLMQRAGGEGWAKVLSVLVVIAAMSTVNATVFTGARTNYAFGRDFGLFSALGRWRAAGDTPVNALFAQGAIALVLVFIGSIWKGGENGVRSMVDYTTPVFWIFFLLTGLSVIVLRARDPGRSRPFRVPLYPVTPILFCLACLFMLYSSLAYVRLYALSGVAVLAAGVPLLLFARSRPPFGAKASQISAFPVIIGAKEGR